MLPEATAAVQRRGAGGADRGSGVAAGRGDRPARPAPSAGRRRAGRTCRRAGSSGSSRSRSPRSCRPRRRASSRCRPRLRSVSPKRLRELLDDLGALGAGPGLLGLGARRGGEERERGRGADEKGEMRHVQLLVPAGIGVRQLAREGRSRNANLTLTRRAAARARPGATAGRRFGPCVPARGFANSRSQCSKARDAMPQDAHPYRSVLYMPGSRPRALEKARGAAGRRADPRPRGRGRARPRSRARASSSPRRSRPAATAGAGCWSASTASTPSGARTTSPAPAPPGPTRSCCRRSRRPGDVIGAAELPRAARRAGAHPALGDDGDAARRAERRRDRRRAPAARGLRARHQRPRQGSRRRAHAGPAAARRQPRRSACSRRGPRGSSASTGSTTPSRTPRACAPPASRAATWASTARR